MITMWQRFLKAHSGKGYSIHQLSMMYHKKHPKARGGMTRMPGMMGCGVSYGSLSGGTHRRSRGRRSRR